MSNISLEIKDYSIQTSWTSRLVPTIHIHKEIEIIYVQKGCAQCYADSKIYEIKSGDMFIAFPNQVHYYLNSDFGSYAMFIFSANLIYGLENTFFDNTPQNNAIHIDSDNKLYKLIFDIANENGPFKETVQVGLLNQLIAEYLSDAKLEARTPVKSSNLQKILDYCSQNFTSEISLATVASALHFNKYYISHLLNQKLNISFSSYISTLRINKAIQLMKNGESNMTAISEKSGFNTIRSFNRAFIKITNTTPTIYCKQLNESPQSNSNN